MTRQPKFDLEIQVHDNAFSSDFNNKHLQSQHQNHLILPILTDSSTPHQNPTRNGAVVDNPFTKSKNPFSIPQKRPHVMSHTPSNLSHSTLINNRRGEPVLNSRPSPSSFRCYSSIAIISLVVKSIVYRIFCRSCRVRRVQLHLRIVILLSLPFLYFFTSYHYYTIVFHILLATLFIGTILISLNLALPCLPSIRSTVARSPFINFRRPTVQKPPRPPVIWSISPKRKPENGPISGYWVKMYKNGDVYEGEFHKGKCSGSGVHRYYMSGRYEGDWIDGKYDGYGVETWAKGSRYRGRYRVGLRHGFGVYRFFSGDVYSGEWYHGQFHGRGVYTCDDGSWYFGEFKLGVKHGLGQYHFRNGDTYAGEYFGDKMHGFGVYRFANGHTYEGAWHEGRRQGYGMYTFRNDEIKSGHWQNGVLEVSTTTPSSASSSSSSSHLFIDHSKVVKAIQEARRAAEKVSNMEEVEEGVKKAMAAASRAANAGRVAAVKAVQNHAHNNNNYSNDIS
ncbi:uncharacterized protein LOC124931688 [Impatiens glandulifera]|uniref:uncharacterized protein LOC124931688 n=1 Tax=Impatiens glandulifera TaxID=253017 RepID=UPI001FB0873B|nr:uncharacterized protein LOC124931688 [Impatiens glandulifera]